MYSSYWQGEIKPGKYIRTHFSVSSLHSVGCVLQHTQDLPAKRVLPSYKQSKIIFGPFSIHQNTPLFDILWQILTSAPNFQYQGTFNFRGMATILYVLVDLLAQQNIIAVCMYASHTFKLCFVHLCNKFNVSIMKFLNIFLKGLLMI